MVGIHIKVVHIFFQYCFFGCQLSNEPIGIYFRYAKLGLPSHTDCVSQEKTTVLKLEDGLFGKMSTLSREQCVLRYHRCYIVKNKFELLAAYPAKANRLTMEANTTSIVNRPLTSLSQTDTTSSAVVYIF